MKSSDINLFLKSINLPTIFYFSIFSIFFLFKLRLLCFGLLQFLYYLISNFSASSFVLGYGSHYLLPWKDDNVTGFIHTKVVNEFNHYYSFIQPYLKLKSSKKNDDNSTSKSSDDEVMNDNKTNTYNLRQRNVNTTDKGNKDTLKNPSEDDMDNVEDNTRIGI